MKFKNDAKRNARKAFLDEARAEGLTAVQKLIASAYTTQSYFWFQKNIRGPFTSKRSKERFSQHYHGKVVTLDQAAAIINVDREIPMRDLEQVIPYSMARNFVLSAPPDIVLTECACRKALGDVCKPSQVCMIIGKPFTDLVMTSEPSTSRRISREEALELLRQEHERGHIHSAWFKDAMLNRFYAICNCCKDHCLGIRFMAKYHVQSLAPSGYSVQVDSTACNSCGKCVETCPFDAVASQGKLILNDVEKCMGCGVCIDVCRRKARRLVRDESKGIPLDVREMESKRDSKIEIQEVGLPNYQARSK